MKIALAQMKMDTDDHIAPENRKIYFDFLQHQKQEKK